MKMTFEFPEKMTTKLAGVPVEVNLSEMPEETLQVFFRYGVQKKLNDKVNSSKPEDLDKDTWRDMVVAQAYAGELESGHGGRTADPVEQEMKAIVLRQLAKKLRTQKAAQEAVANAEGGWKSFIPEDSWDKVRKAAERAIKARESEEFEINV